MSERKSWFGITVTGIMVAPAQSRVCIGSAGFGCKRYSPLSFLSVSSHCRPSSFVIIREVALNACPRVTFRAFLISSNPVMAVFSLVLTLLRIILLRVTRLSSPSQLISVPVILASLSASSSFVTGRYPAYFPIS